MDSTEKPHTDRHKYIMNDFNYDATNTLTSDKIYGLDIISIWLSSSVNHPHKWF